MAKNTLKSCRHLADLIERAPRPALRQLSSVEGFAFLETLDASWPEGETKNRLHDFLHALKPDLLVVADQEAVRLLQLLRFRTEMLLTHAFEELAAEEHPMRADFDSRADFMTRLIWLRAHAPRIFDQIETICLTHHFHGHKKFQGFAVPDGDGRDFVWTEEIGERLHEAVGEVLELSDAEREGCEIIHFEMEEGDAETPRRLHYLVVYHPGKMRVLRQMKERRRDLLLFTPALEATLVYDPAENKVHVLSDRQSTAQRLADRFSLIGFEKPLSHQPVDAVSYELGMFRNWVDLKTAKATGAVIEDAWISSLTVSLGHTRHSVTLALAGSDNIWGISSLHFGEYNPLTSCRSVQEVKLSFVIRFDAFAPSPRCHDLVHLVPEIQIHNRRVLTGVPATVVIDLADEHAVVQKAIDRIPIKELATALVALPGDPTFGLVAAPLQELD